MEATRPSETSDYNKRTWRHIPGDSILQFPDALRIEIWGQLNLVLGTRASEMLLAKIIIKSAYSVMKRHVVWLKFIDVSGESSVMHDSYFSLVTCFTLHLQDGIYTSL
jgi:hypothetical protein